MSTSKSRPEPSRREFIAQASCAGVGVSALFSTLLSLRLANSLAAQTVPATGDYKALVCLFFAGGNDSFNMLVPTSAGEYDAYAKVRGNLALAKDTLLQITPSNLGGRTLGIHPSMPEVRDLFSAGKLTFVSNVGSLIRPMTLADYKAAHYLPVSLYSHADQQKQWQTCIPDQRTAIGWGGRAADIIRSLNTPSLVSMNISLSGQSIFLTGQQAFAYNTSAHGATALTGYDPTAKNNLTAVRSAAVDGMLGAQYQSLFDQSFAGTTRDAVDAYYDFTAAVNAVTLKTVVPSTNATAGNLAMVARIAAAHDKLGARRQVFFVQMGGFDNHSELLNNQVALLRTVSTAVNVFWQALVELGLQDKVTLFSASDFSRTLTSNGNGSDHAWGANHFVLGGAIKGGQVCGNRDQGYYPDLQNLAQYDTGQGRLVPGIAVDEYARDLLTWFGVQSGDLDYVLPGFSGRFSGRPELGIFPPPPTVGGGSGGGGSTGGGSGSSGGGALGPLNLGALGALWALRKLAERKDRMKAEIPSVAK